MNPWTRAVAPDPRVGQNEARTGSCFRPLHRLGASGSTSLSFALAYRARASAPVSRALRGARTNQVLSGRRRGVPVEVHRRSGTSRVLSGFCCGHLQRAFSSRQSSFFGFRGQCSCLHQPVARGVPDGSAFAGALPGGTSGAPALPFVAIDSFPSRSTAPLYAPRAVQALGSRHSRRATPMPRNLTPACSGLALLAADAGG